MARPGGRPPLPKNVRDIKSGRKPKTAAKKELDLPVAIPETPDTLSPEERDVFEETASRLAEMRVISTADVDALVIYARNWVEAQTAHTYLVASGLIIKSPKGYPIQNPYLAIRRRSEQRCMSILQEFGMTPAARVRVSQT